MIDLSLMIAVVVEEVQGVINPWVRLLIIEIEVDPIRVVNFLMMVEEEGEIYLQDVLTMIKEEMIEARVHPITMAMSIETIETTMTESVTMVLTEVAIQEVDQDLITTGNLDHLEETQTIEVNLAPIVPEEVKDRLLRRMLKITRRKMTAMTGIVDIEMMIEAMETTKTK